MRKHNFTIFTHNGRVHGYLFDVTRADAQKIVSELNLGIRDGCRFYYMEGFR